MLSGSYRYRLNGEVAPVEEHWSLTDASAGTRRGESWRRAGDTRVTVTAEIQSGAVRACEVEWQSPDIPRIAAQFEHTGSAIRWRRTQGSAVAEGDAGTAAILYPLMRVFTGPVISALAAKGGAGEVLVPDISTADVETLLLPQVSLRRVVCEGEDHLQDYPGRRCRRWQFIGGQYDPTAKFWLDEHSRLLRYQWTQGENQLWQVELVD